VDNRGKMERDQGSRQSIGEKEDKSRVRRKKIRSEGG